MNWKMTCVGAPVTFKAGEPIAMILPIKRGEIETFEITTREIGSEPELQREYQAWFESRRKFLEAFKSSKPERLGWQKDYFLGHTVLGETFQGHQTELKLKHVTDESGENVPGLSAEAWSDGGGKFREQRILGHAFRLLVKRVKGLTGIGGWRSGRSGER
jgi:uncharacterized protein DUF6065